MSEDDHLSRIDEPQRGRRRDDVSMKDYVDSRIAPWQRRMELGDVTLREYVEGIMVEHMRAVKVAEREHERGMHALREELTRLIRDGENALQVHIAAQIEQVKAALNAAELLEISRIEIMSERLVALDHASRERVASVRREMDLVHNASELAISKASLANEKRFESVNEFRAQLDAQAREFLPREVAEAQFIELRRVISDLSDKVNKVV